MAGSMTTNDLVIGVVGDRGGDCRRIVSVLLHITLVNLAGGPGGLL